MLELWISCEGRKIMVFRGMFLSITMENVKKVYLRKTKATSAKRLGLFSWKVRFQGFPSLWRWNLRKKNALCFL